MTVPRFAIAVVPLALLAACDSGASDNARAPSGTVLEGTISDAMLPVDTVKSEPPFADPVAAEKAQQAGSTPPRPAATAAAEGEPAAAAEPEAAAPELPAED